MGIEEMKKPAMVPCPFIKDGCGCAIYTQKPPTCSLWSCAWALGVIPEEFDPRSTGLTFTATEGPGDSCLLAKAHPDPEKNKLWMARPDLIGFLKGLSYKIPILIGTYISDAAFKDGEMYVFTEEQRADLRAGKFIRVTEGFDLTESGPPQWLRD